MSAKKAHRLVVLGNSKSGKTAVIEQLVFGNHVVGQVRLFFIPGAVLLEAMCKPRSKLTKPCNLFVTRTQESSSTLGDVYEVCAEAGSGNTEKLQIFDTPGDVSVFTSGAYFRNECF